MLLINIKVFIEACSMCVDKTHTVKW